MEMDGKVEDVDDTAVATRAEGSFSAIDMRARTTARVCGGQL